LHLHDLPSSRASLIDGDLESIRKGCQEKSPEFEGKLFAEATSKKGLSRLFCVPQPGLQSGRRKRVKATVGAYTWPGGIDLNDENLPLIEPTVLDEVDLLTQQKIKNEPAGWRILY
jgi:hypothetical protein